MPVKITKKTITIEIEETLIQQVQEHQEQCTDCYTEGRQFCPHRSLMIDGMLMFFCPGHPNGVVKT